MSVIKLENGKYRARARDAAGKEHARHFDRKRDADDWVSEMRGHRHTGVVVNPARAKITMADWTEQWLAAYASRRASTVRQAKVHVKLINDEFGPKPLAAIRPSHVNGWTAQLKARYSDSYTYAVYRRLSQVMEDALQDGLIPVNPCSRRTSPGAAEQRAYVATTDQIWDLYYAFPENLRAAVLLGAFAGLRVAEVCGLEPSNFDFLRGTVTPTKQFRSDRLKTRKSEAAIPVDRFVTDEVAALLAKGDGVHFLLNQWGQPGTPWVLERHIRDARVKVGLPDNFRFHDLRHYYASLLISQGLDIKTVQTRLRHANAMTTLNTYGHLFPDTEDATRNAVGAALGGREAAAERRSAADRARTADYMRTGTDNQDRVTPIDQGKRRRKG